jgi:lysophospholipase L1-like esterase
VAKTENHQMKITLHTVISLLLYSGSFIHGAEAPVYKPEADSEAETSKKPVWSFTPNSSLPDVLILGDSISIGYTLQVRELLMGKANVFRPVSPDGSRPVNCDGTTYGVQQIDSWLVGHKWSVIQFNWGLHDLKHVTAAGTAKNSNQAADPPQATVEEYSRNLEAIVGKLKATGAHLIFATTTPVSPGTTNPLREVDAPGRYNAAALKIMKANGVQVNDLFAFCDPQLEKLQLPQNVHFKPEGSAALAKQVSAVIEAALPKPADMPRTP